MITCKIASPPALTISMTIPDRHMKLRNNIKLDKLEHRIKWGNGYNFNWYSLPVAFNDKWVTNNWQTSGLQLIHWNDISKDE